MTKAVIFDMYETLITLWADKPYMSKAMAEEAGIELSVFREIWNDTEEDRATGKRGFEDVLEEILKVNNRYDEELWAGMVARRKASKVDSFNHVHEGIIPMLDGLKAAGIKIGLITNCFEEERIVIRDSVLFPYFDAVCMSCEEGIVKPDIRIFERCLERLGVEARDCLYCGDGGSRELETAESLNMKTVQACWYLHDDSGQPVSRKPEFIGAWDPMDIVKMIGENWDGTENDTYAFCGFTGR